MPEHRYYRRGHWVHRAVPDRRSSGTWTALAVAAFLGWGLLNGCTAEEPDAHREPAPAPSVRSTEAR
ncbi:hypothetical protein [Streptomyces sp. NPDC053048]|uniref:hypothetical protein n=1 Tax=Streptomyces sp. NPDC053048 TaxID=3365694 RepID=UPI0037CE5955